MLRVPNAALRFKPVAAGPTGMAMLNPQIFASLGLTDDQKRQARQIYVGAARQAFGAGGDAEAGKQAFAAANARFEALLDPAQKAKFEALLAELGPPRGRWSMC